MRAVLLTLLLGAAPPDDAALLEQAETSFELGVARRDDPAAARPCFRRAADLYEELRRRGVSGADFFRDQGNACLLADDLAGAVLAYRRGLRLTPNDRALQAQLAWAREQVVYPQPGRFARPPVAHRPPWLPRLPVPGALTLAFVLFAAGCVGATRRVMRGRGKSLTLACSAFALTGLLGLALALQEGELRADARRPLVVVAQDGVLMRKGNGEAYPRRSDTPLNRGVEARLLFERGDWAQIELSDGEAGWVPHEYVLIDGP